MAEIWGAAIAVGGAVISGVAKSKQAKEDRKNANADAKAANADEAKWGSLMSQFESENEYRMEQMRRRDKQRGLDEFRKFSTVSQFAPQYTQDSKGIVVPEVRTMAQLESDYNKSQAAVNGTANPESFGGKGSSGSLLDKLDPIGAKLGSKDPVRKALGKLF